MLAASVGLVMTGFGIIMPVFARRLGELGSGVEALGLMTMSFALAQFLFAPLLGSFADRIGRRPVILLGLPAFAMANVGYLLAQTTAAFIAVRTMGGALTAGLFPASMGGVAGPLLVVAASTLLAPQGVFITSGVLLLATLALAFIILKEPRRLPSAIGDVETEASRQRALCAQASLRGVVLRARAAREARTPA